jgi:hypothetical protein
MMDINDHPLQNKFYKKLKDHNTDMEEFIHKCWGPKEAYKHHSGKSPIDGGYKTLEVKILNLAMLTFAESPGDHGSFVLDVSTQSLLGVYRYKVCRPVSRRLVTSQETSVKRYNAIIREQFEIQRIEERLNAVDNMTQYCGYPLPRWLRLMIIKLYKQMAEIRIHTEKNCRKILQPDDDFSPTIKMWYDRIHAYLQLIRMKEGKLDVFPSHQLAATYRHKSWSCLFFLIFVVDHTVHQLCSHGSECHALEWFGEYICPHFFRGAVNYLYLPTVHSVFDKEELCFDVFCFLPSGESTILYEQLRTDIVLIQSHALRLVTL